MLHNKENKITKKIKKTTNKIWSSLGFLLIFALKLVHYLIRNKMQKLYQQKEILEKIVKEVDEGNFFTAIQKDCSQFEFAEKISILYSFIEKLKRDRWEFIKQQRNEKKSVREIAQTMSLTERQVYNIINS